MGKKVGGFAEFLILFLLVLAFLATRNPVS
jgi:hypothetical protein